VRADIVVGSRFDPRENSTLSDYPIPPDALVLTEGDAGGAIITSRGEQRYLTPHVARVEGGAYGAGDSFAAALTFYLAAGCDLVDACSRAAVHGAAVLRALNPLDGQTPLSL
jgi:ribokinase